MWNGILHLCRDVAIFLSRIKWEKDQQMLESDAVGNLATLTRKWFSWLAFLAIEVVSEIREESIFWTKMSFILLLNILNRNSDCFH